MLSLAKIILLASSYHTSPLWYCSSKKTSNLVLNWIKKTLEYTYATSVGSCGISSAFIIQKQTGRKALQF